MTHLQLATDPSPLVARVRACTPPHKHPHTAAMFPLVMVTTTVAGKKSEKSAHLQIYNAN